MLQFILLFYFTGTPQPVISGGNVNVKSIQVLVRTTICYYSVNTALENDTDVTDAEKGELRIQDFVV